MEEDEAEQVSTAVRLNLFSLQPIQPPVAEPPTAEERRVVYHYRTLRARIHDGPFYAILDSNARVSKSGHRTPPAAHFDPFEGQQTYTQRFMRKKNTLPRLSTRPFVKEFFPRELWATIAPNDASSIKKSLHISTRTKLDKFNVADYDDEAENDPDNPDGDDDNADENKDDEDKEDEEDPDQFDEDDEDDGDDYNAEQYFDGGDDEGDYDEGGGGDDDY
ncbi:hypothetical protein MBLNU459_g1184t1 [Dothideomycetes sp. NU459]